MRPFTYSRAATVEDALAAAREGDELHYLAGGTNLLDLMKLDVLAPRRLVDINALAARHGAIEVRVDGLGLGALVRMAEAANDASIARDYPAIRDALKLAASAQLRNMATLAGNVLQRTRCNYFRDVSWPCNKRRPGSGCSALEGVSRRLAVLGVSEQCIANYPGDLAHVLAAFDASVDIAGPNGTRRIRFEELHRLPGDTPHVETTLAAGELITAFFVPYGAWTRRSVYVKIRDRESYDFALASAAVGLELREGVVAQARIGIGGLAAKPWRSHAAEAELQGRTFDESVARRAAEAAFADARATDETAFKPELGRRTLLRAMLHVAAMKDSR